MAIIKKTFLRIIAAVLLLGSTSSPSWSMSQEKNNQLNTEQSSSFDKKNPEILIIFINIQNELLKMKNLEKDLTVWWGIKTKPQSFLTQIGSCAKNAALTITHQKGLTEVLNYITFLPYPMFFSMIITPFSFPYFKKFINAIESYFLDPKVTLTITTAQEIQQLKDILTKHASFFIICITIKRQLPTNLDAKIISDLDLENKISPELQNHLNNNNDLNVETANNIFKQLSDAKQSFIKAYFTLTQLNNLLSPVPNPQLREDNTTTIKNTPEKRKRDNEAEPSNLEEPIAKRTRRQLKPQTTAEHSGLSQLEPLQEPRS